MCNFLNFAIGQISCPNMAILKIDPYVNGRKFYTGNLDFGFYSAVKQMNINKLAS